MVQMTPKDKDIVSKRLQGGLNDPTQVAGGVNVRSMHKPDLRFIINPPDFIAYRELYDEHGPEGLKSRPVEEDFVTSGEQKVSDRVLTPFYLSKAITNIASGDGREVNKVVALKIPKSLHNDLVAQFEITGGQPLLNHPMRLTKSGKGLNTRYTFVLDDGTEVTVRGDEEVEYDGEMHTAANLFDALKEGYYGKF